MAPPFTLRTLGGVDLTDADGRRVLSVLSQPKRLAILIYLTVEGLHGPVSRDRICALLWPENDQESARRNLRNGLHFLRRSLGSPTITTVGDDQLVIDVSVVRCDVSSALADGNRPQAPGTFLAGFHVRGTGQAFEDWVGEVRRRLQSIQTAPASSVPERPETSRSEASDIQKARPLGWITVAAAAVVVVALATRPTTHRDSETAATSRAAVELYEQSLLRNFEASRDSSIEAAELLQQAVRIDPGFAAAYAQLALVLAARSMFTGFSEAWADSAARVAVRSIDLDPEVAAGHLALSYSRFQQSRYQEAVEAGLRVLEFEPSHPLILNNLGFISAYRGDPVDAIRWARRAVQARPDWAPPRTLVALMLGELGYTQLALDWLRSAAVVQPSWPPNSAFEAQILALSGRLREANSVVNRVLVAGARTPVNLNAAVDVALGQDDIEGALLLLSELHGMAPDMMPPFGISVQARLGLTLLAAGRIPEAQPHLRAAEIEAHREMNDGNESKNYRLEMASIDAARGEVESALGWLDEAYRYGWRELDFLIAVRPGLVQLSDEEGFKTLLDRIGADQEAFRTRLESLNLVIPPPSR